MTASDELDVDPVRVLRPKLPTAESLLPYLRRIDATRIYSNFGPLALEFEARLCAQLGLAKDSVVSASTGTAGLVGAILASAGRAGTERPLALMPAFSFVATAVAAHECGYRPSLVDVTSDSWMLDPEHLLAHPDLQRIGVVIPVATFGRPVPQAGWLAFRERTGIPVVIDGAASFEAASAAPARFVGPIPLVLSFHATKSLATGEGGCVASTDIELVAQACQCLNFGFRFERDSRSASINGKMSEYHAAVGLAELDAWPAKQQAFQHTVGMYRRMAQAMGLEARLITAPEICSSYILFRCPDAASAARVRTALDLGRIEHRLWYGLGLQEQSYFRDVAREALPVTEQLAPCLIGLPMAPDLDQASIARVLRALVAGGGR